MVWGLSRGRAARGLRSGPELPGRGLVHQTWPARWNLAVPFETRWRRPTMPAAPARESSGLAPDRRLADAGDGGSTSTLPLGLADVVRGEGAEPLRRKLPWALS